MLSKQKGIDISGMLTNQNVTLAQIETWPRWIFLLAICCVVTVVIAATYYIAIQGNLGELRAQQLHESQKVIEYGLKRSKITMKDEHINQMAELDQMFEAFIEKMPVDSEVPEIIEDITRVATQSGLVTSVISIQNEEDVELYTELPIKISVSGQYHNLGNFVAGLTQLERLVSLHDFSLEKVEGNEISLKLDAKTYRFNPRVKSQ
jgi:type IV pilus assembly protein PilO